MENETTMISNSNWKSGLCWGNLAGCLAFYHTLTGFIILAMNSTFIFLTSDYQLIFASSISLGFIIIFLGLVLLPLVFACVLGRKYHIYATIHAYVTFSVNMSNIILILLLIYQLMQLENLTSLSSRFLFADLAMLILTFLVGIVAWVSYVGRQFHEPNGQFILQL